MRSLAFGLPKGGGNYFCDFFWNHVVDERGGKWVRSRVGRETERERKRERES